MRRIPAYTKGALDLGGASTQITFIPQHQVYIHSNITTSCDVFTSILLNNLIIQVHADYSENVRMYGFDYTVYSHSYLCYGLNEARRRMRAHLVSVWIINHSNLILTMLCMHSSYAVCCVEQEAMRSGQQTITDGCLARGNSVVLNYTDIFEVPCSQELGNPSWKVKKYIGSFA